MRAALLFLALIGAAIAQDAAIDARRIADLIAQGSRALEAGRLDEVDAALAQAPAGRDIRVEILRAELLLARKDAATARTTIATAITTLAPAGDLLRTARRTLARALVELGRFGEAAPVILASYGIEGPGAASSFALAARGFAERNEIELARASLYVAVLCDPSRHDLVKNRALLAIEDGDGRAALRDADRFLVTAPADAEMRRIRARALHALGRSMEARDALAALDRAAPLDVELVRVLAALDAEAGLVEEAEALLGRLGLLSGADVAPLLRTLVDRGDARAAVALIGRHAAAARDADVVRLHARAVLDLGEPAQAVLLLRGIGSPSVDDQILLAEAVRLSGDPLAAATIVEPVLARDAANVRARAELILARMMHGDTAAARALLRDGLALAPSDPALVRLLDDLVIELGVAEGVALVAVLSGDALSVGGEVVSSESASAVRQLRALRGRTGTRSPVVRLLLGGAVDARALQRALDLLAAAGLSRVRFESR